MTVRVKTEDRIETFETEEEVIGQFSKLLAERFRIAFTAPCNKTGPFFNEIGFLGDTNAAQQILEGTYLFPPDTDPATRLLFKESTITYVSMSKEEVARYVMAEDF